MICDASGETGEAELGQVARHRRLECDVARGHQAHQRGGGERLGDRADQEQRVAVDRQRVLEARHPVARVRLVSVEPDADGDPGHAELLGRRLDELGHVGLGRGRPLYADRHYPASADPLAGGR